MKKAVIVCCAVFLAGVALYRYSGLGAQMGFDQKGEEAIIKEQEKRCMAACPSRAEWVKYCKNKRMQCEQDCELLRWEGKSDAEVAECKKACAQQEAKDLASYKNKAECEAECAARTKRELERFGGQKK